ncbi:hypothetical protein JTE90_019974 [Oedothorax gibbosus]|uniref:ISXO2-like transposase domain-containing protein n=1 Tax=Oedothorax gibbosus TaxID=931172 RepID=A0AAV6TP42_9ARAC|nr:hypothetical protein JTE90_019974 [Oedothorax gibbosus]
MTYVVFGMYCREDKEGLFFIVNSRKKVDLWPRVVEHCHPDTTVICTDSAKSYVGVEKLFEEAQHKKVNHSKGEYVQKTDKKNHINSIENQNRILKATILSRKSKKLITQYMALYYYRRTRLQNFDFGKQISLLIEDIRKVYPGPGLTGLTLKHLDDPTPSSTGIEHCPSKGKGNRRQIKNLRKSQSQ